MQPFAPFTEDQFRLMAMYKARAYAWDSIAEEVHLPLEVVERVAWTHEKQWHRFLTKAERHVAREALAEVVGTLRNDVRNTEPQYHATIANSLSRVLKLQQEYAPKKRPRRAASPPPPSPVAAPDVSQPAAPKPPADMPPPTPKMTTEEMNAFKKRLRDRLAGAACALLAFVCLCALLFGRVLPTTRPIGCAPTVAAVKQPAVATAPPNNERTAPLALAPLALAPSWRAPPSSC